MPAADPAQQAGDWRSLNDEAAHEWGSLGLISFTSDADDIWRADLGLEDIEQIRSLINRLAAEMRALAGRLHAAEEALRGLLEIADAALPGLSFQTDSRVSAARAYFAAVQPGGDTEPSA
jgi:hypothetical protein